MKEKKWVGGGENGKNGKCRGRGKKKYLMKRNESHFPGKQNTLAFLLSIITPEEVYIRSIWMDEWTNRGRDRRKMERRN